MATGKRKRAKKTSKGIHGGGGKVRNLTEVQKVLLGVGLYASFKAFRSPGERSRRPDTSSE